MAIIYHARLESSTYYDAIQEITKNSVRRLNRSMIVGPWWDLGVPLVTCPSPSQYYTGLRSSVQRGKVRVAIGQRDCPPHTHSAFAQTTTTSFVRPPFKKRSVFLNSNLTGFTRYNYSERTKHTKRSDFLLRLAYTVDYIK